MSEASDLVYDALETKVSKLAQALDEVTRRVERIENLTKVHIKHVPEYTIPEPKFNLP